ncbi:hypothetical protein nACB1_089 [Acinetobacter phage nACB1]|nr:hypothetical protein nACB1_089 [Acinetobacter phage nACB1]
MSTFSGNNVGSYLAQAQGKVARLLFPSKSFYLDFWHLVADANNMLDHSNTVVEPFIILKFVDLTRHLPFEYQDFILLNISHAYYLWEDMIPYYGKSHDVIIMKVLQRLIECNLYFKYKKLEYNLPARLGRQYRIYEADYAAYIKAIAQ